MARRHINAGDPARSLALLWRTSDRVGRSGLTLDAVVSAATELADAEGLEALSMRRLAERLGAGTMSLYTHVPGRAELTDLMVDAVYGELYAAQEAPEPQAAGWRAALEFIARQNWALYRRHPWLLDIGQGRPSLGPHGMLKYERELRPLEGLGLSDIEMDAALTLLLTHVEGSARLLLNAEQLRRDSGRNDQEWWAASAPLLQQVFDPQRFPLAARVGTAAGEAHGSAYNAEYSFTFGLSRLLDGVATLISQRR